MIILKAAIKTAQDDKVKSAYKVYAFKARLIKIQSFNRLQKAKKEYTDILLSTMAENTKQLMAEKGYETTDTVQTVA